MKKSPTTYNISIPLTKVNILKTQMIVQIYKMRYDTNILDITKQVRSIMIVTKLE